MKFLKKGNNLGAFTLAELIVAVVIGSLVLSVLMSFIATSMNEITYSNKQTEIIEKINTFSTSINNYKGTFESSSILINKTGTGSDVIVMANPEKSEGIMLGIVSLSSMKLEEFESNYNTIYEKYMGIRQLTATDIIDLENDSSLAYTLSFNEDKLFKSLIMKDFQASSFNTGAILDTDLDVLINYKEGIDGEQWDQITNDWIYKINMNF